MHFVFSDNQFEAAANRLQRAQQSEKLDEKYGYKKLKLPCEKLGWLINLCSVSM